MLHELDTRGFVMESEISPDKVCFDAGGSAASVYTAVIRHDLCLSSHHDQLCVAEWVLVPLAKPSLVETLSTGR